MTGITALSPRNPLFALAMILAFFASTGGVRADSNRLSVTDAWVRLAPPALKTHGGYLTIRNEGAEPDELISASSDHYGEVQMHVSRMEGGIATMEQLASVEIPAGGKVAFQPGGLHLMLVGPRKPLELDAMVPVRLRFRSGATLDVQAKVLLGVPEESMCSHNGGAHGGQHHTH